MNSMNMHRDIISDWQAQHERLFGQHAIKLRHRLAETGLFTRESVGKLIERCPQSHFGLESVSFDGETPKRIYGELGNATGLEAIEAIEKGRMWMNIRRVMDWAPEYNDLLNKIFSEFEARMDGLKTFKRNIGVLISSPNAKVPYHADIQGQSLWQISGVKRVFIYPRSDVFMSSKSIEKILLRETNEDMPYRAWFDDYATTFDLQPGEMLTWPLYAPHKVENHDCLNISVTMEHWTKPIWNSYAVHYGNGVLRRTLGLQNTSTSDHGLHVYPKAASALLWKKMGRQIDGDVVKTRDFRIAPENADGRVSVR
ncbi:hypothetical protein [Bradyrhizobium sp. SYSU BS000235]|uniref:hypothetical protein n=1 Tax=Bradyrhizobium sp. SYSU BS000235 TaxID=3411332 RepID=UPI003C73028B